MFKLEIIPEIEDWYTCRGVPSIPTIQRSAIEKAYFFDWFRRPFDSRSKVPMGRYEEQLAHEGAEEALAFGEEHPGGFQYVAQIVPKEGKQTITIIKKHREKIVGECTIDVYSDGGSCVKNIHVEDRYRKQGHGEAIYRAAIKKAHQLGATDFYSYEELSPYAIRIQRKLFPHNSYYNEYNRIVSEEEAKQRVQLGQFVTWQSHRSSSKAREYSSASEQLLDGRLHYTPERARDMFQYLTDTLGFDSHDAAVVVKDKLGRPMSQEERDYLYNEENGLYRRFAEDYQKPNGEHY